MLRARSGAVPKIHVIDSGVNERVTSSDLRGLRKLREALGLKLVAGVVLSTGTRSYTIEDRLHVLPVDRLWTPVDL